jgi:hypothetical protein
MPKWSDFVKNPVKAVAKTVSNVVKDPLGEVKNAVSTGGLPLALAGSLLIPGVGSAITGGLSSALGGVGSALGLGGTAAGAAGGIGGLGGLGGSLLSPALATGTASAVTPGFLNTLLASPSLATGALSLGSGALGNVLTGLAGTTALGGSPTTGLLGGLLGGGAGTGQQSTLGSIGQLLGLGGGGGGLGGGLGGLLGGLSAQDLLIGGGSLASSIYGAQVAEKAAQSQREAIDNAIASLREGQSSGRGDIQSAMADTNALIQQQNPITQQALDDSNALLGRQNTITQQALDDSSALLGRQNTITQQALDDANALLQQSQGTINQGFDSAASTINPFYQSGTAGLGQLQQLAMGQGVPEFLATNPAYQFRQQEAQRALERSAAARGGLMSGQFAKALQERSQGLASEEFGNAFNRLSGLVGMGQQAGTQLAGLQTQRTGALANVMGARAGLRERAGERFAGTLGAQAGLRERAGERFAGTLGAQAGLRERAGERFAGTVGAQAENRARGGQLLGGMSQGFAGSLADLMRSRGDAVATGQIGQTNAYNQGLANLTQYVTAPKYRFAGVGA